MIITIHLDVNELRFNFVEILIFVNFLITNRFYGLTFFIIRLSVAPIVTNAEDGFTELLQIAEANEWLKTVSDRCWHSFSKWLHWKLILYSLIKASSLISINCTWKKQIFTLHELVQVLHWTINILHWLLIFYQFYLPLSNDQVEKTLQIPLQ